MNQAASSERIVPLVMCGGAGTRLWPSSREGRPKQFLPLLGSRSTFQETMLRVADVAVFARPIVITNIQYRFIVKEQLAEIGIEADILLEPMRQDSGPAIAAGAVFGAKRDGNPVLVALAADHIVTDKAAFVSACREAADAARGGRVVTFGVKPDRPATEYGYIRPGAQLGGDVFAVEQFVEKPDEAKAKQYIAQGYLWNSGNFVFAASDLLDEYSAHDAATVAAAKLAIAYARGEEPGDLLNGETEDGSRSVPSALLTPEAVTADNVKELAFGAGGFKREEVCEGEWAAVCEKAGV